MGSDLENRDWKMTNYSSNLSDVNVSNNLGVHLGRDENLAKIEIGVQAAILFLAIFGNATVLIVIFLRKNKLSRMNLLIVHLSLADLFVAFFNILPQMLWDITYRFYGNDFLCKFVKYFQVVAMYASSYVLITTAIDRHIAICKPLSSKTMTPKLVQFLVFVAWLLSLVFAIPQVVLFGMKEISPGSQVYDCWADFNPEWTLQAYITFFTIAVYIIPFFILLITYGQICIVVWHSAVQNGQFTPKPKNHKDLQAQSYQNHAFTKSPSPRKPKMIFNSLDSQHFQPRAHTRTLSKSKIKTVKMTLTVILCYVLCWGPFFVAQMWSAWDINAPFRGRTMTIILLLASLNSCTNPWIYLAFNNQISQCYQDKEKITRNGQEQSQSTFKTTVVSTRLDRYDAIPKNDSAVVSIAMENLNSKNSI